MDDVLFPAIRAHHRRRRTEIQPGGDHERAAKVPENHPVFQLHGSPAVRQEKRLLLSSGQGGQHQVSGPQQGSPVPAHGREIAQVPSALLPEPQHGASEAVQEERHPGGTQLVEGGFVRQKRYRQLSLLLIYTFFFQRRLSAIFILRFDSFKLFKRK